MAGMFVDVVVEPEAAADPALARKLEEVCPVDIFAVAEDGTVRVVQENLDECTLCDLCIEASPPGAVRVVKLYAA
jgi:NAD-dependent dihydropyrimidine dehydrogenase PreA subunit